MDATAPAIDTAAPDLTALEVPAADSSPAPAAAESAPATESAPAAAAATPAPARATPAKARPERRHDRRYPVHWRAVIELRDTHACHPATTVNLSPEGAMLRCEHNLPGSGPIRLHLQLPPLKPGAGPSLISLTGRITHTSFSGIHRGFLIGLRFDGGNSAAASQLAHRLGYPGAGRPSAAKGSA